MRIAKRFARWIARRFTSPAPGRCHLCGKALPPPEIECGQCVYDKAW